MNIEKLRSLKSAVNHMMNEGVTTLEPVRRYMDASIEGSFYSVAENGCYVVHPIALRVMNENLMVIQAGIDYIMSHIKNREVYDAAFDLYLKDVAFHTGVKSKSKNPVFQAKNQMASAFGTEYYDDENFKMKDFRLEFEGLSGIISTNFLDAIKTLTQRKAHALMFLSHSQVISQQALRFNIYKEQYNKDLDNLYDRHGWNMATDFRVDHGEESACGVTGDGTIAVRVNREDLTSLFNAKIQNNELRFGGKKVIVASLTEVDASEVANAAKKIKTVTDLNGLKLYRIEKGIVIKNSQEVNDYWNWRRFDSERKAKAVSSLEGHYLAVMDTPEMSFQTVGTSLGRTISSCSKQLQNKVMESLDLDDLI